MKLSDRVEVPHRNNKGPPRLQQRQGHQTKSPRAEGMEGRGLIGRGAVRFFSTRASVARPEGIWLGQVPGRKTSRLLTSQRPNGRLEVQRSSTRPSSPPITYNNPETRAFHLVFQIEPRPSGRTCGPVAPTRTGGTHPLLQLVGDRHPPRPAHRQNLPSVDFSQAAYHLPEFQVGRMDERLQPGAITARISIPSGLQPCLLATMSSPWDSGAWPAIQEQQCPSQVWWSRR